MVDGMRERTALGIADKLDYWTRSVMSIHNVPTLPKLCDCGEKAADMLRQQHAEIERLTKQNAAYRTLNSAQSKQLEFHRSKDAEYQEAIATIDSERAANEMLTAERDAAIAAAVAAEREAISEQLRELADELGYGSSWWGPPGGLLLRAADMVSARSAT